MGLSPKENREVPPLKRDYAARLKADFPEAVICINGGIATLDTAEELLKTVDGVMVGREAYKNPCLLTDVDARLFGLKDEKPVTRSDVVDRMTEYLKEKAAADPRVLRGTARHMLGLLNGLAGGKIWRRMLSDPAAYQAFGAEVLHEAYARAGWRESAFESDRMDDDEF